MIVPESLVYLQDKWRWILAVIMLAKESISVYLYTEIHSHSGILYVEMSLENYPGENGIGDRVKKFLNPWS